MGARDYVELWEAVQGLLCQCRAQAAEYRTRATSAPSNLRGHYFDGRARQAQQTSNALAVLVDDYMPACSQCGQRIDAPACGPTHAAISVEQRATGLRAVDDGLEG